MPLSDEANLDPPHYEASSGLAPSEWLRQTFTASEAAACGFKLPYNVVAANPLLLGDLATLEPRVVLLRRTNRLAQYVSVRLAEAH